MRRALLLLLYMLEVGLVRDKLGNYSKLPLHGTIQPPELNGPKRWWQGCGGTPGVAAPGLAPLATVFAWSVPKVD